MKLWETVKCIASNLKGINPKEFFASCCFEIERRLKQELNTPVFHDDQHGTAVVVLTGLINVFKLIGKRFQDTHIVIDGAGSVGIAICKLLMQKHPLDITLTARRALHGRSMDEPRAGRNRGDYEY